MPSPHTNAPKIDRANRTPQPMQGLSERARKMLEPRKNQITLEPAGGYVKRMALRQTKI